MSTVSEQLNESDLFEEGEYQRNLRRCNFSTILQSNSLINFENITPEVDNMLYQKGVSSSFSEV